jgi:hypothetical protein
MLPSETVANMVLLHVLLDNWFTTKALRYSKLSTLGEQLVNGNSRLAEIRLP